MAEPQPNQQPQEQLFRAEASAEAEQKKQSRFFYALTPAKFDENNKIVSDMKIERCSSSNGKDKTTLEIDRLNYDEMALIAFRDGCSGILQFVPQLTHETVNSINEVAQRLYEKDPGSFLYNPFEEDDRVKVLGGLHKAVDARGKTAEATTDEKAEAQTAEQPGPEQGFQIPLDDLTKPMQDKPQEFQIPLDGLTKPMQDKPREFQIPLDDLTKPMQDKPREFQIPLDGLTKPMQEQQSAPYEVDELSAMQRHPMDAPAPQQPAPQQQAPQTQTTTRNPFEYTESIANAQGIEHLIDAIKPLPGKAVQGLGKFAGMIGRLCKVAKDKLENKIQTARDDHKAAKREERADEISFAALEANIRGHILNAKINGAEHEYASVVGAARIQKDDMIKQLDELRKDVKAKAAMANMLYDPTQDPKNEEIVGEINKAIKHRDIKIPGHPVSAVAAQIMEDFKMQGPAAMQNYATDFFGGDKQKVSDLMNLCNQGQFENDQLKNLLKHMSRQCGVRNMESLAQEAQKALDKQQQAGQGLS